MISAGFLIVAVCPGAAYGPPFTAMAKGNVAVAVGLMVILAGSSVLCVPLLLQFLLPLMAKNQTLRVDAFKLIVTLLVSQLLPLFAGLCLHQWRPAMANKLKHPADRMSGALNLWTLGLIVVAYFRTLAAIRARAFIGMLSLVAASMGAGWLLGEMGSENRKAMGFSTSVRNVAVSLVVATASFPGTPAVTAALVYGLLQTVALAAISMAWGSLGAPAEPTASDAMMDAGR
jgi:BASS family bile acid:Na+ symporter